MDIDAGRRFLADHKRCVLVTLHADGRPQASPVLAGVDQDGRAVVSTQGRSAKVRNLSRDPRVSLCVVNEGFFGDWAVLEGRAEIVPLPAAMDGLVGLYRQMSGEHPDWEEFRAAMAEQGRVLLRIDIERTAGPGA